MTKKICLGTGLITLDIIINNDSPQDFTYFAGGSCGNVMTILSFLGWDSKPIARFFDNKMAKRIIADLSIFGVDNSLLYYSKTGTTPVILQRNYKDNNGNVKHKFEFQNPLTGEYFPRFRPILLNDIDNIVKKAPACDIFYFDRVSPAIIRLAEYYNKQGALIYFEPSAIGDINIFTKAISCTHILKFSNQRLKKFTELFPSPSCLLEIETLGKDGLCYRSKTLTNSNWITLSPSKVDKIVDTSGAGDWTSAGIIHKLGNNSNIILSLENKEIVEQALAFGQHLGALNCTYEGARGIMYTDDRHILQ